MKAQCGSSPSASKSESALWIRMARFTARALSVVSVGVVLVFAVGEGLNLFRFSPHELILFAFFPLGTCLGLLVGWRCEWLGGGMVVASVAGFYLTHRLFSQHWPHGLAFAAFALPGFLFLVYALGDCWGKTSNRP